MKLKLLLIAVAILFCHDIFCQLKVELSGSVGVGKYAMKNLHEFNTDRIFLLRAFELKKTRDFPAYYFYSMDLCVTPDNELYFGMCYRLASTGYYASRSDYSGTFEDSQILQTNQIGILLKHGLWKYKIKLWAEMRAYYSFTSFQFNEIISINNVAPHEDKIHGRSQSIVINPAVSCSYEIFTGISVKTSLGYSIDTKGVMKDQYGHKLTFNNEKLTTDWSGIRADVGIQCHF
jgi:hypothetical protein